MVPDSGFSFAFLLANECYGDTVASEMAFSTAAYFTRDRSIFLLIGETDQKSKQE